MYLAYNIGKKSLLVQERIYVLFRTTYEPNILSTAVRIFEVCDLKCLKTTLKKIMFVHFYNFRQTKC